MVPNEEDKAVKEVTKEDISSKKNKELEKFKVLPLTLVEHSEITEYEALIEERIQYLRSETREAIQVVEQEEYFLSLKHYALQRLDYSLIRLGMIPVKESLTVQKEISSLISYIEKTDTKEEDINVDYIKSSVVSSLQKTMKIGIKHFEQSKQVKAEAFHFYSRVIAIKNAVKDVLQPIKEQEEDKDLEKVKGDGSKNYTMDIIKLTKEY